jgi:hypothetical protein
VSANLTSKQLLVARTLRRFGLVDQFGFDDLIRRGVPLTQRRIEQALTEASVTLPRGITVKYIASQILGEIGDEAEEQETGGLALAGTLTTIPRGRRTAARYHDTVLQIFRSLFKSQLGRITKEQSIFDKAKRVDLKAENNQPSGFFNELRTRYELYCPYVFFECKNYADDPANPEYDQLFGRLGRESTQVGAIVCRQLVDSDKALAALRQPYRTLDRKLAIIITDDLIREMVRARGDSGVDAVDEILQREYERVLLST